MAAGLVENRQRQDLNAVEEAEGYRRLVEEFDMTQAGLGRRSASPARISATPCVC